MLPLSPLLELPVDPLSPDDEEPVLPVEPDKDPDVLPDNPDVPDVPVELPAVPADPDVPDEFVEPALEEDGSEELLVPLADGVDDELDEDGEAELDEDDLSLSVDDEDVVPLAPDELSEDVAAAPELCCPYTTAVDEPRNANPETAAARAKT